MVYTGIVQTVGNAHRKETCELRVYAPGFFSNCNLGDSISVNGVCLTLVEGWNKDNGLFFVMEETRGKTNLFIGDQDTFEVNLEKSMNHGDVVGGHYILGHVHGLGVIESIKQNEDGSWDVWIDISGIPKEHHIVYKGCISIDGTSLTVAELNGASFRVSLIPHTINNTIFRLRKPGDLLNIEFDLTHAISPPNENNISTDEDFMMEAIKAGEQGRYTAPPNPWVGCVLCKDGHIIGVGYHAKAGQPHAERIAFQDAEEKGNVDKIKGCTVYVTLEPCHHFGRTPPCDAELVRRKVARVVIAVGDPDFRVNGEGIKLLLQNNIQVSVGVCQKQAEKSLEQYLYHRNAGKPYVIIKSALSLDGRIACEDGTSQWITGPAARKHVHQLRARCQAIIVGSETALTDDPRLTVRDVGFDHVVPLRVVLDSRGRVIKGNLLNISEAPTVVYTTEKAPQTSHEIWQKAGVEVKIVSPCSSTAGLDIDQVLQDLGKRGVLQVLIEGGAQLQSSFINQNLGNSLVFYFGACLIGSSGKSWAQSVFTSTMEKAKFWKLVNVTQLDNDICTEYVK